MPKLQGIVNITSSYFLHAWDEILPVLLPQMKFFCENEDILGCFASVLVRNAKYHSFEPRPTTVRCIYFKQQKFTSQNLVDQAAVFCVRNALKVIYEYLRFEKIFRGLYPGPSLNRGGARHYPDGRATV
jgi:hypothetical protein